VVDFFTGDDLRELTNPGVTSRQLIAPHNAPDSRVTITHVTVAPDAVQPRHFHETSEQTWVALEGAGTLLLGDDSTRPFQAGDVVRFADGDVHGLENSSTAPFVYMAVTSPPIDFKDAYQDTGEEAGKDR
jgi:quercetin dioxygenase-like cupin family protein